MCVSPIIYYNLNCADLGYNHAVKSFMEKTIEVYFPSFSALSDNALQ